MAARLLEEEVVADAREDLLRLCPDILTRNSWEPLGAWPTRCRTSEPIRMPAFRRSYDPI